MSDERNEREARAANTEAVRADDARRDGDGAQQGGEDAAWLERVRDVYTPEPMSPAERLAFDTRLEERIETSARSGLFGLPLWQPISLMAVVAVAVWLTISPAPAPTTPDAPPEVASVRRPASLADWEREILAAAEPGSTPNSATGDEILPDDYRAIAGLFLGADGGGTGRGQ